jgi:biopolymer transport protein TolQ
LFVAGAAMGGRLAGLQALDLVLQAGWLVQLVLVLLLGFSVLSWALIYTKWRELRRAGQDSEAFLEVYRDGSFDAAYEAARAYDRSPLAAVFVAGYAEIHRMAKHAGTRAGRELSDNQLRTLSRHVAWAASQEALRLERGLSFLATTGSSTPFIGLFGTVVGIINAFEGIGRSGTASLAVVAPGIAEALIATAVGLLAAIPATIFYNYFLGELRQVTAALDLFVADLDSDFRRLAGGANPAARAANG